MDNINWYPGHMKKTKEMIQENLKLVDVILEVVDARIPISGRNPIISELIGKKDHILLVNKVDLADDHQTRLWLKYFSDQNIETLKINSREGNGIKQLIKKLEERNMKKSRLGNNKPFRIMIVGVPNSGKSSLINRLLGKKAVAVGNIPGFTKGKQWVTLGNKMQLLDTPGILWPKFEDPKVGLNLAFCGSIKDEIMDIADLSLELVKVLSQEYPDELIRRYGIEELSDTPLITMESIAEKRGLILPGKRIDYERTGRMLMDEFRSGKIGRITLEHIESGENNE